MIVCKVISFQQWYNRWSTGAEALHICLLKNLHCVLLKLEIAKLLGGMLLTLNCMNALASSGNTPTNHVSMPFFFLASQPKVNMHPYLHEYYSVAKFKAAYATPIPALTDQSQWPEMPVEFGAMCPPLTKRKAGRPKQSRFKAWFEKGGSKKKKTDDKPKRTQKGNKNRCKLCQELGHRAGSAKCRFTPEKPKYVLVYFCVLDFF